MDDETKVPERDLEAIRLRAQMADAEAFYQQAKEKRANLKKELRKRGIKL